MIEALLSRGLHFKDKVFLSEGIYAKFLKRVVEIFRESKELVLYALENLLAMVDEAIEMGNVLEMFDKAYEKAKVGLVVAGVVDAEPIKEGKVWNFMFV